MPTPALPRLLPWALFAVILSVAGPGAEAADVHHDLDKLPVCGDCSPGCVGSVTRDIKGRSYSGIEADYVVVGAGTSGSILASRLAEAGKRVILIEAGGTTQREFSKKGHGQNYTTVFDVPLEWLEICRNPEFERYQWAVDGTPKVAIAKGIGGCSIHNAMLYMRGIKEDFEEWPDGWKFEDILPYYTKSENNSFHDSSEFHGKDGPIQISSPDRKFMDSITPKFIQGFQELGYPFVADFNGPVTVEAPSETGRSGRTGAGYLQFAIRDGIRDSSAAAFFGAKHPAHVVAANINLHGKCLRTKAQEKEADEDTKEGKDTGRRLFASFAAATFPWDSKTRLHIFGHSHATRVLIESSARGSPPRAKGVNFVRLDPDDKPKCRCSAFASEEVILSAGTINSPKLLMLSGVGPKHELEAHEIEVLSDVEGVGQNFMDGAYAIIQFEAPTLNFQRCEEFTPQIQERHRFHGGRIERTPTSLNAACNWQWEIYMNDKKGLFGTPGFFAGGFMQSPGNSRPNIQLTLHPYDKINQQPWNFNSNRRSKRPGGACALHKCEASAASASKHNASSSTSTNATTKPAASSSSSSSSPARWKPKSDPEADDKAAWRILTVEVAHNLPKSRGSVHLKSDDPLIPAVLNGSYLSVHSDVEALIWAIAEVRTLFNTLSLKPLVGKERLPGKQIQTPEQMERYIKCATSDPDSTVCHNPNAPVVGHLAGTCKMGDLSKDASAVVDSQLRVRGTIGLRVADASVMPSLPSGNTHATCMMIAEKAADLILNPPSETLFPLADKTTTTDSLPDETLTVESSSRQDRSSGNTGNVRHKNADGDQEAELFEPMSILLQSLGWLIVWMVAFSSLAAFSVKLLMLGHSISKTTKASGRQETSLKAHPYLKLGKNYGSIQQTTR